MSNWTTTASLKESVHETYLQPMLGGLKNYWKKAEDIYFLGCEEDI